MDHQKSLATHNRIQWWNVRANKLHKIHSLIHGMRFVCECEWVCGECALKHVFFQHNNKQINIKQNIHTTRRYKLKNYIFAFKMVCGDKKMACACWLWRWLGLYAVMWCVCIQCAHRNKQHQSSAYLRTLVCFSIHDSWNIFLNFVQLKFIGGKSTCRKMCLGALA